MFKELNPLIHSQLRLAIMTLLLSVEEADFTYLKEKTNATSGNLSVQLDKLSSAGYIKVNKDFVGKSLYLVCHRCLTFVCSFHCQEASSVLLPPVLCSAMPISGFLVLPC